MRWSPTALPGLLLILAACSESATSAPTPPEPPPPPPPVAPPAPLFDRIIFLRARNPGTPESRVYGLWTIRPDGTDLRVLRDSLHYPSSAAVSPNGLAVVFEDWDTLYIMRSDGLDLRAVATGMWRAQLPSWSPDGQWIYFSGQPIAATWPQIYRIHPDGSGRQQLTQDGIASWHPTLSHDGRYLAYTRNYYTSTPTWLVIQDLTTRQERTVSDSSFTGRVGHWAPDDQSLLFLDGNPQSPSRWAVLRFDLRDRSYRFFLDPLGNRNASYSPDGGHLLFGTGELWVADSDGTNGRPILADSAQNFEAYWAPASP